ncbi:MAG TPA: hypothetical protein VFQ43_11095 [Nitrososphaera sp.]|nr:hypothetical protein [Nitrososphaera sp.]
MEKFSFRPKPKSEAPEKEHKLSFPPSLEGIQVEKSLGGSSGVMLGRYEDNVFAIKRARRSETDPKKNAWYKEQLKEEYVADKVYEAMGFAVPSSRMYKEGSAKVSSFVRGKDLNSLDRENRMSTSEELRRGFVLDALLANWDVIGLVEDNIRQGEDGRVYRLDNGGSFRFRAMGEPKGAHFGPEVGELESLRAHNKLYADVSQREIAEQIDTIIKNRDKIIQTIERSGEEAAMSPESTQELVDLVSKRIGYLEQTLEKFHKP